MQYSKNPPTQEDKAASDIRSSSSWCKNIRHSSSCQQPSPDTPYIHMHRNLRIIAQRYGEEILGYGPEVVRCRGNGDEGLAVDLLSSHLGSSADPHVRWSGVSSTYQ